MPCFKPLSGWRSAIKNPATGKRSITFNFREAYHDMPVTLACGQCIGCRLEKSRQWAVRCLHEASLHERNCFITLTYNPENVPSDGSLNLKHFQDFMKRLRRRHGAGIRFFHAGEYGEKFQRPHYHACIFNFDFDDKKPVQFSQNLFHSKELEDLWENKGFCTVGAVTFESAAYVARYCTKKITGEMAADHYGNRKPEYTTMSRRPGIGSKWFEKYASDVYPDDFVVVNGKTIRPPKYYDRLFEIDCPKEFIRLKNRRQQKAEQNPDYHSIQRWIVKEKIAELRFKKLERGYENG